MNAVVIELTKFLAAKAQYYIPIYQRKYSWKKENCLKLVDDIIKVAQDEERPCHFIGSVIYLAKEEAMNVSAVNKYLVIDGQQRLTTLSIVLLALGDYTKTKITEDVEYSKSTTSLESLSETYLIKIETGDIHYKIRLNEEDFYAWKKLLENRKKPDDIKSSKIFENYNIVYNELCNRDLDPQLVFKGIEKLKLVDICLVPKDNAQLVFETVNSTGLALSTADKIRNFILMTVEPSEQEKLYIDYWHPMEKAFGMESGEDSSFNSFFHYFMTSVLQRWIGKDCYDDFKNYYYNNKSKFGTKGIVEQIYRYSKYYTEWLAASNGGDRIQKALFRIRETKQLNITPVILKLLSDKNDGLISDDDVLEILTIIESYWMRRMLCALPSNTAGTACISMLKSLYSEEKLKSFKENIFSLTWAQRMPTDTEMREVLRTLKIYSLSSQNTKLILDKLENNNRKEYVPTKEYTIEHIMPQTLSDDWKADLGENAEEIHEKYLHTIGNLTLTGYNPEYQNKRFLEKLDCTDKAGNAIGYRHTPIKIRSYLTTVSAWGEREILERTEKLSNELIEIWKYPVKD